jgi:hypothetical protein
MSWTFEELEFHYRKMKKIVSFCVLIGNGVHPTSSPECRGFSGVVKRRGVTFITRVHLVFISRMLGAMHKHIHTSSRGDV